MIEVFTQLLDFVLHIDQHLVELVKEYEGWIYLILFLIIFCETGLIVTPFLPGDSLLFALGALAAIPASGLDVLLLMLLLIIAAILGDSFNYYTGTKLGARVVQRNYWFLRRAHIKHTQRFYLRYGGRTIIYARFAPIVRTFAPFVAGIGHMEYKRFLYFNIIGAFAWVVLFVVAGYLFGNIQAVKQNFSLLILGIIILSVTPLIAGIVKGRLAGRVRSTM